MAALRNVVPGEEDSAILSFAEFVITLLNNKPWTFSTCSWSVASV